MATNTHGRTFGTYVLWLPTVVYIMLGMLMEPKVPLESCSCSWMRLVASRHLQGRLEYLDRIIHIIVLNINVNTENSHGIGIATHLKTFPTPVRTSPRTIAEHRKP